MARTVHEWAESGIASEVRMYADTRRGGGDQDTDRQSGGKKLERVGQTDPRRGDMDRDLDRELERLE